MQYNLTRTLQALTFSTLAATIALVATGNSASAFTLSTGTGDGDVTVGVDAFGSFGTAVGGPGGAGAASYNPLGSGAAASTTFDSGVAIRFGSQGTRTFLTSGSVGGSQGGTVTSAIAGNSTSATSGFSFGGLNFGLVQSVSELLSGAVQTGSRLTQTYTITNTTSSTLAFDLVRYLDGDLYFDGSLIDGGGRLSSNILFETDSATGAADSTTFVGINADGGTSNGYEINSYSGLRSRIIAGQALSNSITNDNNSDGFIDAGRGYDVTLAVARVFSLGAGQSATYTTTTFFGSGAPQNVPSEAVPEPMTMAGLALAGAGLTYARRRKQAQQP